MMRMMMIGIVFIKKIAENISMNFFFKFVFKKKIDLFVNLKNETQFYFSFVGPIYVIDAEPILSIYRAIF